jgi:putative transcriptional regulator
METQDSRLRSSDQQSHLLVNEPFIGYLSGRHSRNSKRLFISTMETHRLFKGLSQAQLAERVGVSRQTISLIENAKQIPGLDVALMISEILEVKVEGLFRLH